MIKPYYQEENITIYNGDCLEVMKELPDKSIDLVLTSPPYDNLRTYETFDFDFGNIAKGLFRITKNGGCIVWVVADQTVNGSETATSFKQALYFKDLGFNLHDTMIYAKNNYVPNNSNRYEQQFEYMFVLTKGKPNNFNPIKINCKYGGQKTNPSFRADPSGKKKRSRFVISIEKTKGNLWFYNIGNNTNTNNKYIFEHPATFPEQLAKDHINSWSNTGDLILDPFLGSGTTARACKDLNRKCIGIEISKKYCDIAIKRLGQEVFNFAEAIK